MRLRWIVLLHILPNSSLLTWYVLLPCLIWTFENFNRVIESMNNLLYILIDKYFPPWRKSYHGHNLLEDNMILLLLLFILIEQMSKDGRKTNWLWVVKDEETTKTKSWPKSLVVKELNANLSWDLCHDILGRIKPDERLFVNEMIKYHMELRYIKASLKDRDPNNMTSTLQVYKERSTYWSTIRGSFT